MSVGGKQRALCNSVPDLVHRYRLFKNSPAFDAPEEHVYFLALVRTRSKTPCGPWVFGLNALDGSPDIASQMLFGSPSGQMCSKKDFQASLLVAFSEGYRGSESRSV